MKTTNATYVQRIVNGDSFSSQHAPAVHFGLGSEEQVQRLLIEWPDGATETRASLAADSYVELHANDIVGGVQQP